MGTQTTKQPKLPPAWFKHLFWRVHRFFYFAGVKRRPDGPRKGDVLPWFCSGRGSMLGREERGDR